MIWGEKGCLQEDITSDMATEVAFKETIQISKFWVGDYRPQSFQMAAFQSAGGRKWKKVSLQAKESRHGLGMAVHTYNPPSWEAEAARLKIQDKKGSLTS